MARVEQIKKFTILPEPVGARRRRAHPDDEAQAQADRREVRRGDRGALLGLARWQVSGGANLPGGWTRSAGEAGPPAAGSGAGPRFAGETRWSARRSRAPWWAPWSARAPAAAARPGQGWDRKAQPRGPGAAAVGPASSSMDEGAGPDPDVPRDREPARDRPAARALRRPDDVRPRRWSGSTTDGYAGGQPEPGLRRLVQGRQAPREARGAHLRRRLPRRLRLRAARRCAGCAGRATSTCSSATSATGAQRRRWSSG